MGRIRASIRVGAIDVDWDSEEALRQRKWYVIVAVSEMVGGSSRRRKSGCGS